MTRSTKGRGMSRALASTLVLIAAGGCMVGPNYKAPDTQMPDAWHEAVTRGLAQGEADLQTWWKVFDDPELTSLVERAAKENKQLKEAIFRIREARAQRGIATGELFPSVNGDAFYDRSRVSANGLQVPPGESSNAQQFASGVAKGYAGPAISNATGIPAPITTSALGLIPPPTHPVSPNQTNLSTVGFDATWEIDVFGGIRRNVESADASLQATIEQYRDLLVTLYSEVALNYMEVRTFQARLAYARANVDRQRKSLDIAKSRFKTGLASELDPVQAESNLAESESEIPILEAGLVQAINRLGVLLGQPPAFLFGELDKVAPIPVPPAQVAIGLPTDLLRQRPDIRSAERQLASLTAQIGVSTADLYPRFSLSGTFALQGTQVSQLGNFNSRAWSFGPAMQWNIFDGVRNIYRVLAATDVASQARARYEQAVLTALQDVENAMVAYKQEQIRRDALARAVTASSRAVDLVQKNYQEGLTDFQNVLDTERSLFQQQDRLADSEGQVTKNLVALYKALGGGWSPEIPDTQPFSESVGEDLWISGSTTQPAGS
jgi:outer membrane protein, multidrug efflux system